MSKHPDKMRNHFYLDVETNCLDAYTDYLDR